MVSTPPSDEELFDFHEYYRIFLRRWKVIAGIVGVGLGLVITYLLLATPLYTATTEILIDARKQNVIEGGVVSGLDSSAAAIASEVRVISSFAVARRVIKKLRLDNDPEFGGGENGASLWTAFSGLLGLSFGNDEAVAIEGSSEGALDKQAAEFAELIRARRLGITSVISVTFTSRDRVKAAIIANEIASAYLVDQLEAKFEATRRANVWLRGRLRELQASLQESEKAVELYRAQHNLVGGEGATPFETQLKKLNEELILSRIKMKENLANLEQVQEIQRKKGDLTSVDIVAQSDVVQKTRTQLAELAQREAELTTRFTAQHPKVLNIRAERKVLLSQRNSEARRIIDNLKNENEIAKRRIVSIENSLKELKDKTKGSRSSSIRLRELERERAANRAIYEAFLNRFKETSQQETLQTTDSRVITPAQPPNFASYPNKKRTVLLALIGFSALGIGFALLLEKLDNSFKTGEQIEETLNVAHLTSVPKLTAKELKDQGQKISVDRYQVMKPLSSYAEAIRALKVGIQLSNIDTPPKMVLITSSLPNEGKTAICCNLAQHAAQAGSRTLLIDADLRNPSLTRKLVREPGPGLIEVLAHKVSLEQSVIRDQTGFEFLQTSNVAQNSAEILGSQSMKDMLKQVQQVYDYVIIDSSPITPVIDARVLVDTVDSVVLVIEWDKTPRDFVAGAIKSLNLNNEKFAGTVLNKMDMKRMASYGNYGYGSYYKNYPHYYGTSE